VIAHSVVDNGVDDEVDCELWMVKEHTAKVQINAGEWFKDRAVEPGYTYRAIDLALIGPGGHSFRSSWGYKSLIEAMHPFYYSCPLSFLEMVPAGSPEVCPEWRAMVRKWHVEQG